MSADDSSAARIAELEAHVAQLNEQCAAARRELESFTYAVSHDLRAPLRSLSGFSQALLELPNDNPDSKAQHYLNRIQQAGRKMSDLIDALLSLSRISRADMQLRTVDFTQLCREAVDALTRKFPERSLTVTIAPAMQAYGDSRMLRTAVELLLDNAWKFTAARTDAAVTIGQEVTQNSPYYVQDNGAGFDMAYAEKLFRPFQRLHTEAQFPGIGIGLACVQRIISRHNGQIWAKSATEQGTTIYFSLPAAPAVQPSS